MPSSSPKPRFSDAMPACWRGTGFARSVSRCRSWRRSGCRRAAPISGRRRWPRGKRSPLRRSAGNGLGGVYPADSRARQPSGRKRWPRGKQAPPPRSDAEALRGDRPGCSWTRHSCDRERSPPDKRSPRRPNAGDGPGGDCPGGSRASAPNRGQSFPDRPTPNRRA